MALTKGKQEDAAAKKAKKTKDQMAALKDEADLMAVAATLNTAPQEDQAQTAELQKIILERIKKREAQEAVEAAEEEARLEAIRAREKRRAQEATERDRQAKAAKMAGQDFCPHLDGHNKRATGGQYNSDGYYSVFCLRCDKEFSNRPGSEVCPPHLWPGEDMGGASMEPVNTVITNQMLPKGVSIQSQTERRIAQ